MPFPTPIELAKKVSAYLTRKKINTPNVSILKDLFQILFNASLKTEESESIKFHLVYMDPDSIKDELPLLIRENFWQAIPLSEKLEFNTRNLVKVACATDPRSSSIAVYNFGTTLYIWGFIDQAISYNAFVNFESEGCYDRPGLFQASILGIGHIAAYTGIQKIAELKQDRIIESTTSPFTNPPLSSLLHNTMYKLIKEIRKKTPKKALSILDSDREKQIIHDWHTVLCRIILRIQNFGHGGTLLITPDTRNTFLNVKYQLVYDRIRNSFISMISNEIQNLFFFESFITECDNKNDTIKKSLSLSVLISDNDLDDSRESLNAAIWFVSLLTKVDGLVLLNRQLQVRGFGVEITADTIPSNLYMARDSKGKKLQKLDYNHFGTRHRSLMRYCWANPGSIGIVVSQDSDVRIISKIDNKLLLWENIKLQLMDFISEGRSVKRQKKRPKK